jgi:hypothetical protein
MLPLMVASLYLGLDQTLLSPSAPGEFPEKGEVLGALSAVN